MPVLHIYSGHLNQHHKVIFASEATDIIVATLNADINAVKIFFNEYAPSNFAGAGVLDADSEFVDAFQCQLLLLAGRTAEQHKACVKELTDCAIRHFSVAPDKVRIFLQEMPKTHYSVAGTMIVERG